MPQLPIRLRLTAVFTALMAAVIAGVGIGSVIHFAAALDEALDQGMEARVHDLATSPPHSGLLPSDRDILEQVITPTGRVLAGSAGAGTRPVLAARGPRPPRWVTRPRPGARPKYCERQGRCILGCLPGARHPLNKTIINALLDPPGPGPKPDVTLRSLTEVDAIHPLDDGGYEVLYRDLRATHSWDDRAELPAPAVTAPVVVVAAGTLGSTELLLRSQRHGLSLSDTIGTRFSSNGDFSGFAVLPTEPGQNDLYPIFPTRGPTNTSHVMFADGKLHMTVEDGGIPAMFASVTAAGLQVLSNALDREPLLQVLLGGWLRGKTPNIRDLAPELAHGTEDEKIANIFWFNAMGTDRANGRFDLDDNGNLTLGYNYPAPALHPILAKLTEVMQAMTAAMGGDYVPFPL